MINTERNRALLTDLFAALGNGDRSGDERFNCIGAGATAPTFPLP